MFENRTLLIVTKHKKEQVIAPLFEKHFGVKTLVAIDFDTDILGTFTGEIERKNSPLETAKQKCLLAMQLYQCDMAIASEGSFGPHPAYFFTNADDEFLFFIDTKNDIEIYERELSVNTNFNGDEISNRKELLVFAENAKFPEHALILRNAKDNNKEIIKGINTMQMLLEVYEKMSEKYNKVYVETDMRAMYNPSRMAVIEIATEKLISKIKSVCPACATPGFAATNVERGLPCGLCGLPTRTVINEIYNCRKCSFSSKKILNSTKTTEDPIFCDNCNP